MLCVGCSPLSKLGKNWSLWRERERGRGGRGSLTLLASIQDAAPRWSVRDQTLFTAAGTFTQTHNMLIHGNELRLGTVWCLTCTNVVNTVRHLQCTSAAAPAVTRGASLFGLDCHGSMWSRWKLLKVYTWHLSPLGNFFKVRDGSVGFTSGSNFFSVEMLTVWQVSLCPT